MQFYQPKNKILNLITSFLCENLELVKNLTYHSMIYTKKL